MHYRLRKPFKTNDTYVAPNAVVIGDVINWDESSVMHNAVIRADSGHVITIGFSSTIQDGAVVYTLPESRATLETGFPPVVHIGHYVDVGAGSVLISCHIDHLCIIGEKCTILEGAIVETKVILEPGTVVPAYARIPSGQRWGGNPARFIEELNGDEIDQIQFHAEKQHTFSKQYWYEVLPWGHTYAHLEDLELEQMEKRKAQTKAEEKAA